MHKYIKLTQLAITISEIITWMKESERKDNAYE